MTLLLAQSFARRQPSLHNAAAEAQSRQVAEGLFLLGWPTVGAEGPSAGPVNPKCLSARLWSVSLSMITSQNSGQSSISQAKSACRGVPVAEISHAPPPRLLCPRPDKISQHATFGAPTVVAWQSIDCILQTACSLELLRSFLPCRASDRRAAPDLRRKLANQIPGNRITYRRSVG